MCQVNNMTHQYQSVDIPVASVAIHCELHFLLHAVFNPSEIITVIDGRIWNGIFVSFVPFIILLIEQERGLVRRMYRVLTLSPWWLIYPVPSFIWITAGRFVTYLIKEASRASAKPP